MEQTKETKIVNKKVSSKEYLEKINFPIGKSKGNVSLEQTFRNKLRLSFFDVFADFLKEVFNDKELPIELYKLKKGFMIEIESSSLSSKVGVNGFLTILFDATFKPLNFDALEEALIDVED